jgi:hypothetical protein
MGTKTALRYIFLDMRRHKTPQEKKKFTLKHGREKGGRKDTSGKHEWQAQ